MQKSTMEQKLEPLAEMSEVAQSPQEESAVATRASAARLYTWWQCAAMEFRRPTSIAGAGMLSALGIALKGLTINITAVLRISFVFLTAALSGFMFGPWVAGAAAVVVDIFGYFLAPSGAYFFGFTLNAFLEGMLYGMWLYKKPVGILRTFAAVLTHVAIVRLLLNPLWLSMMYGEAWVVLFSARLVTNLVLLPVNTALLYMLLKVAARAQRELLRH